MTENLRIGILGTGGMGDCHAKALAKLPNIQLAALCDLNLEKAKQLNRKYGHTAQCFSDFHQMLEAVDIDALYVCLPPGAHSGEVEAAAQRGIHLFLEKPIALTLSRGQSMAAAVRNAGVKCQIGHHLRHCLPVRKLHQLIQDGTAGRPLFMQGRYFCNALHPHWWQNPRIGGGQLIEQAIHLYDLTRYFLGEAESVTGRVTRLGHERFPTYLVDDASAAIVHFRGGAMASLCATNIAEPCQWITHAMILCENLMVEMQPPDKAVFIYHRGNVTEEIWDQKLEVRREDVLNDVDCGDEINRNFIAAIREDEPLRSSIEDGLEGLRLVSAVAQSSEMSGAPRHL